MNMRYIYIGTRGQGPGDTQKNNRQKIIHNEPARCNRLFMTNPGAMNINGLLQSALKKLLSYLENTFFAEFNFFSEG